MKKIVSAALLSLVTVSTPFLFPQAAKADRVIHCNPVTSNQVSKSADHPNAYADGYREGEQSARNREPYRPRTTGGEFARGFEDGYFNRPYTGRAYVALNSVEQHNAQDCQGSSYYTTTPSPTVVYSYPYIVAPPPVIYDYPYVYPFIGFNFGFGRWWHHGWGHYRRW